MKVPTDVPANECLHILDVRISCDFLLLEFPLKDSERLCNTVGCRVEIRTMSHVVISENFSTLAPRRDLQRPVSRVLPLLLPRPLFQPLHCP